MSAAARAPPPPHVVANVIVEDGPYEAPVVPAVAATANFRNSTNGSVSSSRLSSWHIPRPSLVGRSSERNDSSIYSEPGTWSPAHRHLHPPPRPADSRGSRSSSSSQGSQASTHSAASGTLLLTAANLASLAAMHPPTITPAKQPDTASQASSTHFTMVNGLGRPRKPYKKSYCARNQLTVLVCTTCFLFTVGLLAGVLYMDSRTQDTYN